MIFGLRVRDGILTWISAVRAGERKFASMDWQVHYQSGGQRFSAPAPDRSTAIAIACILMRDGHEVVALESATGDSIETDHIRRLCER